MTNPLLNASEQAHINAVRSHHPAHWAGPGLSSTAQFLKSRDYSKAFPYATNGLALAFVGFYLLTFFSVAPDGNHIYTAYRLFPVIAAAAMALSMWFLPDNSLLRLFYLVGLFAVSWLGA